jgi:hypothetical protein
MVVCSMASESLLFVLTGANGVACVVRLDTTNKQDNGIAGYIQRFFETDVFLILIIGF